MLSEWKRRLPSTSRCYEMAAAKHLRGNAGTRVKASYILGGWLGSAAIISGPHHLRRTRTRDAGWDMAVNKWGFHSNRLSLAVASRCLHILKSGRLIETERLAMWSDLCTCLLFAARALLLHHPGQLKCKRWSFAIVAPHQSTTVILTSVEVRGSTRPCHQIVIFCSII